MDYNIEQSEQILGKLQAAQTLEVILHQELASYLDKVKSARNNSDLRELLHGMIGAFHFTGAISIKKLLPELQKQIKHEPDFNKAKLLTKELITELEQLKDYLDKQYS